MENLQQKSLQTFFGIGEHSSSRLLARFNIHPTCRVGELANKQVLDLTAVLSDMKIENDLRRDVLNDIKRLKETGTYRGRRHALGLPVRGQRTRTQVGSLRFLFTTPYHDIPLFEQPMASGTSHFVDIGALFAMSGKPIFRTQD
ncbi:37S ribosomal protein SWS2 [Penicillium hispanicum]|uniref:37S ribosomal protein SWS2 n=1 Tax=Penicillium hispanicum TaxID=1080232 RepID=UPI002541E6CA|nr:37S ribosomal protein SWS2 [Penicillium hispanicum]KAJ5569839.1 37S ribosomal protein SWS2 [Penicillium hispanicum]